MSRFAAAAAWAGRVYRTIRGPVRPVATGAPSAEARDPEAAERLLARLDAHGDRWVRDGAAVTFDQNVAAWTPQGAVPAADGWCTCDGDDPSLVGPPADFPAAARLRYAYVRLAAKTAGGAARGQLFWDDGDGFREAASGSWPIVADGVTRSHLIDLAPGRWLAGDTLRRLRLDPLDRPGQVRIERVTLLADVAQLESSSDLRTVLARRYLRGHGVECGALQNPMRVPPEAKVLFVDRLTLTAAREHYPELNGLHLTPPNLVADLQRLPIGNGRVDFCIGNHLLEHARDPIGGLCEFLRTIRPGGVAFVSVPDVDNPLDRGRPVTPFEHLLADHEPHADRRAEDDRHYDECVTAAHPELPEPQRLELTERYRQQAYSIHFHTFDETSFRQMVSHACRLSGAVVDEYARNRTSEFDEYIAVLRRVSSTPAPS